MNMEKHVYTAIAEVQAKLATQGIGKDKTNEKQGYKYRGIDDVYNVLSPILSECGLCILPRVVERTVTERQTKQGGVLFYADVRVEFDLVAAKDGSLHTIITYGEGMDSGDKATNKAMSAAYKYACFQAFCIPTEGDNDADGSTPEQIISRAPKSDGIVENEKMKNAKTIQELVATMNELSYEDKKRHQAYFDIRRRELKEGQNGAA